MTTPPLYLVFSDETLEYALPHRAGWTHDIRRAGLYTHDRADKAAETMLDGFRWSIGCIPIDLETPHG